MVCSENTYPTECRKRSIAGAEMRLGGRSAPGDAMSNRAWSKKADGIRERLGPVQEQRQKGEWHEDSESASA